MHRIFVSIILFLFALTGCPEAAPIEQDDQGGLENEVAAAVCGDGKITGDEVCDDGNDIDEDACTNACAPAACGDSVTRTDIAQGEEGYEECDDGDDENNDACTPVCIAASTSLGTLGQCIP